MGPRERPGLGPLPDERASDGADERLLAESAARAEAEAAADRLGRLQAISASLVEAATVEQVAAVLVDEAIDGLGAAAGAFAVHEPATRRIRVVRARGYPAAALEKFESFPVDAQNPGAEAVRTGVPVYVSGVANYTARYPAGPAHPGHRAWAAIPLKFRDRVIAALLLSFPSERPTTAAEQALIEALTRLGALAYERAELFASERGARRQAERAVERLVRLQGLTAAMANAPPEEAARYAVEHATTASGADAGAVFLAAKDGRLRLAHARDLPEIVGKTIEHVPPDANGQPAFVESVAAGTEGASWLAELQAAGHAGALAVLPLLGTGHAPGLLVLCFAQDRVFDEEERDFVVALAYQVGQALERARLRALEAEARRTAERGERRAAFLARASALLSASLDYQTTLSRVAELTVPGFADWCTIDLVDEQGRPRRLSVQHGDPGREWAARELCEAYPLDPKWPEGIARTLRTGTTQFVRDLGDALIDKIARDPRHAVLLRALGYASGISVAVSARGRILGALTFVREPTSPRYEPADVELAESLANRVSISMDNAELYAETQQAVKARDEFLSVASHELRTPLTTLILQLQGVRRSAALEPKAGERIGSALRQALRLETLIAQLLDVSRITAGRLVLQKEPADLTHMVRDVAERFEAVAAGSGSRITVEAAEPVTGTWDPLRIDQILVNLVQNALKYGAGTPVTVRVEGRSDRAFVRVSDKGLGIAKEDQERIFQRFERAASERHYGGLGLGLWISRELARAHGGNLSVASAPGAGSTFVLELPLEMLSS